MMNKKIGLKEAISIGIGGMVGGGIFTVLGLAVDLAKGGTPIAFLFAGLLALITCYSYIRLSQSYPDRGGTVKFINQGFGQSVFSGAVNNLLWIGYIIMISLYASAFGSYAPNVLKIFADRTIDFHFYASAVIVISTVINYYSITIVGRIEAYAVIIKLIILLGFIALGIYGLNDNPNLSQLAPVHWESPIKLFAGGMVIFVAYEGFELIANAVPDIRNPAKNIARAYYISVIFVIVLYIVIALVTVGSLPFAKIYSAQDYVLAEAAKPMLGQTGFTVITIAALISTFSAINASLYGSSQVNFEIAEDNELPPCFLSQYFKHPIGLMITALATLILVNVLDLESISTTGSVAFLLIFAIVNFIAFKLAAKINANRIVPAIGCILCTAALMVLLHQQYQANITGVTVSGSIMIFCLTAEWLYQKFLFKK